MALRSDRPLAPYDNYTLRSIQMALDSLAPIVAAANISIPPHRETVALQRANEGGDPHAIFSFVGYEQIGDGMPPFLPTILCS